MTAVVTGAGRGIGRAIAERLARDGHRTYVTDVDLTAAEEVAHRLVADGHDAVARHLDVTAAQDVDPLFESIAARGPLDVVVNNAGVARRSRLVDTGVADLDRIIAVNVRGAFLVLRAAARVMEPQGRGSIVNVSSTSAFISSRVPMVAYDMSKAAVRQMTTSAAHELAGSGVRVNAVAPGTVGTDLVEGLRSADADPGELDPSAIPVRRFGRPSDIAQAVAFLAGPQSAYVTGHTLVVDGGWLT